MSLWLLPYKAGSNSCLMLKHHLGINTIKLEGSRWEPKENRWVINWGNTTHPLCKEGVEEKINFINPPASVRLAVDKLQTFKIFSNYIVMPLYTQDPDRVRNWLEQGKSVVVRRELKGHGGQGIVLLDPMKRGWNIPEAPLYTQYVPKKSEFRIHYMIGKGVFKIQRKARLLDIPEEMIDWKIRNIGNGFIYALADDLSHEMKARLEDMGRVIRERSGLAFFCADVIYNQRQDKFYLLEINTAPGLSENTAEEYARNFSDLYNNPDILYHLKNRIPPVYDYKIPKEKAQVEEREEQQANAMKEGWAYVKAPQWRGEEPVEPPEFREGVGVDVGADAEDIPEEHIIDFNFEEMIQRFNKRLRHPKININPINNEVRFEDEEDEDYDPDEINPDEEE